MLRNSLSHLTQKSFKRNPRSRSSHWKVSPTSFSQLPKVEKVWLPCAGLWSLRWMGRYQLTEIDQRKIGLQVDLYSAMLWDVMIHNKQIWDYPIALKVVLLIYNKKIDTQKLPPNFSWSSTSSSDIHYMIPVYTGLLQSIPSTLFGASAANGGNPTNLFHLTLSLITAHPSQSWLPKCPCRSWPSSLITSSLTLSASSLLGLVERPLGSSLIYFGGTSMNIWMIKGYFDIVPASMEEFTWLDNASPDQFTDFHGCVYSLIYLLHDWISYSFSCTTEQ